MAYVDISLITYTNESKANKGHVFFLSLLCAYKSGSKNSEFAMLLETQDSFMKWGTMLGHMPEVDEINVDILKEDLSGL